MQQAIRGGATVEQLHAATGIDPWFLDQIVLIDEVAAEVAAARRRSPRRCCARPSGTASPTPSSARCAGCREDVVRGVRHALGVRPVYKTVDTCAAEFAATTPYHYSSYDEEDEATPSGRPQGDHPRVAGRTGSARASSSTTRCVHASFALRDAGYETVMVNCNPETVSTDYDTSDRLYFEPLTLEDVLEVVHAEQAGGRGRRRDRPARRADPARAGRPRSRRPGVPIVGTSPEAIHLAEERGAFGRVLAEAGLPAPKHGMAYSASRRPARSPTRSATRCWCGPVTCSAGAAWRSSTTRRCSPTTSSRATEVTDRAPGAGRPVPRRRDRDRRRRALRRHEMYLGGGHGAHRGGRHPLRRLGLRAAAGDPGRTARSTGCAPQHRGDRPRASACAACSTCSSPSPPACSTCWRPTRGPAGRRRSSPRRPPCRWPRPRPGSCSAPRIADLRAEGMLPADGDGTAPAGRRPGRRSRRRCCRSSGSAPGRAASSTACSGRRCARPAR